MPELGKYAAEVLAAYAAGLGLLAVLVAFVLLRARAVRNRLKTAETEARRG